jgi:hypothetical protein
MDAVAINIAKSHMTEDQSTVAIYRAQGVDEVRLIEVTSSVGTTNDILPFRFGPRPDVGVPYPSVVVLLSPEEWDSVKGGRLQLPEGWGSPAELRKIA